jgi:hypothetical protein
MRSIADAIPSLEDADAPFDPDDLVGVTDVLAAAVDAQTASADGGLPAMERRTESLLAELCVARDACASRKGKLAMDLVCFSSATYMASAAFGHMDGRRAHEWWKRSLAADYVRAADGDGALLARLLLWQDLPGDLGRAAAETAVNWIGRFLHHSWSFGDLVPLAAIVFQLREQVLEAVDRRLVPPTPAVRTMIVTAQWALRYAPDDASSLVARLERLRPGLEPPDLAQIELFFSCTEDNISDVAQEERAARALERFGEHYSAGERLALLISTCWGRADDFERKLPELAAAARAEAESGARNAADRSTRLAWQGQPYARIAPAVRSLAEAGRSDSAVALLAAWIGAPADTPTDGVALVLPAWEHGTLWSCAGVTATGGTDNRESLRDVMQTTGLMLGTTIHDPSDPTWQPEPPRRPGIPDYGHSPAAALASERHLGLADDAGAVGRVVEGARALAMVPSMQMPVQGLLARKLGLTLPLTTSLVRPRSDRARCRIGLMSNPETWTSELECEVVTHVLTDVEVRPLLPTADAFEQAYADETLDLLWVASHAELRHGDPRGSFLAFGDSERLTIDALDALPAPRGDRRLLVLNVCDGGASATLGGPAGFGVGPVLAGPSQAVVSHLWPMPPPVAATFGCFLAVALRGDASPLDAFAAVLRAMGRPRSAIVDDLRTLPGRARELAHHLADTTAGEDLGQAHSALSGVFLQ